MFKKVGLRFKLLGSFVVVALITLTVGLIGWLGIEHLAADLNDIGQEKMPKIQALQKMANSLESLHAAQRSLLKPELSIKDRQRQYANIREARATYQKAGSVYQSLPQTLKETEQWQEFTAAIGAWEEHNDRFFKLTGELEKTGIINPLRFRRNLEHFRGDAFRPHLCQQYFERKDASCSRSRTGSAEYFAAGSGPGGTDL